MIRIVTANRRDTETLDLAWQVEGGPGEVTIYAGPTPDSIDRGRPVSRSGNGRAVVPAPVNEPGRPCFSLVTADGATATVAERRVPIQGCFNFRDLGGYPTGNGRRVKWGLVFRSDAMGRLTDHDHETLAQLGVRTVCDFRAPSEVERSPDRLPVDGSVRHLHLPVVHGDLDATEALNRAARGDLTWLTPDFMARGYLNNIETFPHVWGTVFRQLARTDRRPLAFHCSAGKDRAGTCAALILLALGVPEETVKADHALSNELIGNVLPQLHQRLRRRGIDPEPLAPYFQAPREGIEALLDRLRQGYGSARDYLTGPCRVPEKDLDKLREELTE